MERDRHSARSEQFKKRERMWKEKIIETSESKD